MDDLIVIILTLVIAAIGGISRLKKKPVTPSESDEANSENGNFWEELFDEPEIPQPVKSTHVVPEPMESTIKREAPKKDLQAKEGISVLNKTKPIKTDPIKIHDISKVKRKKSALKGFSLRKAVIYSTILERKYH